MDVSGYANYADNSVITAASVGCCAILDSYMIDTLRSPVYSVSAHIGVWLGILYTGFEILVVRFICLQVDADYLWLLECPLAILHTSYIDTCALIYKCFWSGAHFV